MRDRTMWTKCWLDYSKKNKASEKYEEYFKSIQNKINEIFEDPSKAQDNIKEKFYEEFLHICPLQLAMQRLSLNRNFR